MICACLLGAVLLVSRDNGNTPQPAYKLELQRDADKAVVVAENGRTVFHVTSATGIGGLTITLAKGEWPERVALRLQYKEGGVFGNLEQFVLRTDRILVEGNLKSSGRMRFCFVDPHGKPDAIQPGEAEPAGHMAIRVTPGEKSLEVTFPPHLLRGSTRVTLRWIDAFRR